MKFRFRSLACSAALGLAFTESALAQDEASATPPTEPEAATPEPEATPSETAPSEMAPGGEDPTGPAGKEVDAELIADAEAGNSPVELPGKTYHFIGARYRSIFVPKFMIGLFGDGGRTVHAPAFGAEYANRKDAFEYNVGLWYAHYHMDATPFKAKTDGALAWEIVRSKVGVVYITGDFMWSNEFTPELALNYGMGAGLGFVFGPIYRTQARPPDGGDSSDPYTFVPCSSEGDMQDPGNFCGDDNNHYGNYQEPSWADGGSKPIVFPWLAIQTGLRYKPHRNFVARLDLGFGTSGFMLGIGADYGL